MIERFGGLCGVLAAEPQRYAECLGAHPRRTRPTRRRASRDDDERFTQVLLKACTSCCSGC